MNYNPYSLISKTILITGASSGIGRITAIECAKLGAKCVITGRNAERLQETYDQLEGDEHIQIIADLSTQEGINTLVSQTPQLDGVVNNAGIGFTKLIPFIKRTELEELYDINAITPVLIIKSLIKSRKIQSKASLVFVSSIAAVSAWPGNSAYGMAKSALLTFSKYCAIELANKGVRANVVQPGMIETKMIHEGVLSKDDLAKDMQRYPLKRYGRPEDVAWAIIYLLSDASAWVTGTSMVVDGGVLLV